MATRRPRCGRASRNSYADAASTGRRFSARRSAGGRRPCRPSSHSPSSAGATRYWSANNSRRRSRRAPAAAVARASVHDGAWPRSAPTPAAAAAPCRAPSARSSARASPPTPRPTGRRRAAAAPGTTVLGVAGEPVAPPPRPPPPPRSRASTPVVALAAAEDAVARVEPSAFAATQVAQRTRHLGTASSNGHDSRTVSHPRRGDRRRVDVHVGDRRAARRSAWAASGGGDGGECSGSAARGGGGRRRRRRRRRRWRGRRRRQPEPLARDRASALLTERVDGKGGAGEAATRPSRSVLGLPLLLLQPQDVGVEEKGAARVARAVHLEAGGEACPRPSPPRATTRSPRSPSPPSREAHGDRLARQPDHRRDGGGGASAPFLQQLELRAGARVADAQPRPFPAPSPSP